MSESRTLLVTNDFPPRPGGIQSFVHGLAVRQPPGSVVVYASRWRGAEEFDAAQPFTVVRENTRVLLPTPLVALPGARTALHRIGRAVDVTTYLGEYTRLRLDRALRGATELRRLAPGVDLDTYHPAVDGESVRVRLGLADRPVVVCVSRLVPRKGQDMLIRALPGIRHRVPDAALLIVGGGPYRSALGKLARQVGVERDVVFTGTVPAAELPAHYAAGDVYAMPCRTRNRGLDVEGLGIVYLEASATGLPVVAGDSGGAPDAVRDGETGFVVRGRDVAQLVDRVATLLADRDLARQFGATGRAWVEREWRWETQATRMADLLRP